MFGKRGLVSPKAQFGNEAIPEELETNEEVHNPETKKESHIFQFVHAEEYKERASHTANIALRPYANAVDSVYWDAIVGESSCLAYVKRQFQEIVAPYKFKSAQLLRSVLYARLYSIAASLTPNQSAHSYTPHFPSLPSPLCSSVGRTDTHSLERRSTVAAIISLLFYVFSIVILGFLIQSMANGYNRREFPLWHLRDQRYFRDTLVFALHFPPIFYRKKFPSPT